jgi:RNA polymerase sigma factor (sigma-70 family)
MASDGEDTRLDADPAQQFPLLSRMLRDLAERGLGLILGAAPDPRGGIQRVSRVGQAPEPDERLVAAYRARYPMLVRYAAGKVGDHSAAEDAVQRAFEKVLRQHRNDPQRISNLEAYLQTAVCSEINRELRRVIPLRDWDRTDLPDGEGLGTPGSTPDISSRVADSLAVRDELTKLSPREREAVVLRLQWELSVSETAQIMRLSVGAVKRYTSDGLHRLRERLATA